MSFEEVQRLRQWWLVPLVALPVAVAWSAFVQQILLGQAFGNDPAPDWLVWVLWLTLGIVLPVGLLGVRLETRVEPGSLTVRFWPFPAKRVPLDQVDSVRAERLRPVVGWGGYGYRRNLRGDVAFLAEGRGAVRIDGPGGGLVVGSQRPDELAAALHAARGAQPDRTSSEGNSP